MLGQKRVLDLIGGRHSAKEQEVKGTWFGRRRKVILLMSRAVNNTTRDAGVLAFRVSAGCTLSYEASRRSSNHSVRHRFAFGESCHVLSTTIRDFIQRIGSSGPRPSLRNQKPALYYTNICKPHASPLALQCGSYHSRGDLPYYHCPPRLHHPLELASRHHHAYSAHSLR